MGKWLRLPTIYKKGFSSHILGMEFTALENGVGIYKKGRTQEIGIQKLLPTLIN